MQSEEAAGSGSGAAASARGPGLDLPQRALLCLGPAQGQLTAPELAERGKHRLNPPAVSLTRACLSTMSL